MKSVCRETGNKEALERPPHCSFEKNNSKLVSSLGYQVDFQFSQYKQKLLMVWCVFDIMYLHTIFGLFQLLIVQNRYHLSYSKVLKHIYLNFSLTGFFDFLKTLFIGEIRSIHFSCQVSYGPSVFIFHTSHS